MLNITEVNGVKYITLVDLYEALELTASNYGKFISDQLTDNQYASEGVEYSYLGTKTTIKGGRPRKDYLLTIPFAKDIIIRSRSKVGKKYRDWLISLETSVNQGDLLTHDQVIYLTKLKEVFKYITNCKEAERINHEVFVSVYTGTGNPNAAFHMMRNELLNIKPEVIEQRLKQYCIDNQRPVPKNSSKMEKMILINKYEVLRNGVWDFLYGNGHVNAFALAELVKRMAETENAPLFRKNEDNFFQAKENVSIKQLDTKIF